MEVSMEIVRSPDFKQVYAIGAIGGHSPYDFRIAFYNDSPKSMVEGGKQVTVMERKMETEIILSPLAAKELAQWLNGHIKDYEKIFGEIKKPGGSAPMPGSPQGSESSHIQGYM
jgi:outer membrane lipoprotein-sorting protein